jgi:hypothetical protein
MIRILRISPFGLSAVRLIRAGIFYILMITQSEFQAFAERIEASVRRLENHCTNFGMANVWLDNQDVMQLLKISPRSLQSYRDQGILPFTRLGGKIYYQAKAIEDLLERNMSDHP